MSTIVTKSGAKFWFGIDLPYETAYLSKDIGDKDFKHITYKEILDRKRKNQRWRLESKRKSELPITIPGYVWVFYNNSFFFGGWWVYVKTLRKDYALNYSGNGDYYNGLVKNKRILLLKAMELFPMGVLPGEENLDQWAEKFAEQFKHVGFHRNRKQGLAKCRCVTDNDTLVDITL